MVWASIFQRVTFNFGRSGRNRHAIQRAYDLELAGGFTGQVEHAVDVTRAKLAECKLKQHAGFSETRRRLEEHQWTTLEQGGELGPRRFLTGSRTRKRGTKPESAQPLARAQPKIQKLGEALQLRAKQGVVCGRNRDGLRKPAAGFDKYEFRVGP